MGFSTIKSTVRLRVKIKASMWHRRDGYMHTSINLDDIKGVKSS